MPRLIVIDLLKTAKRGFLRLKISADYLNILISIDRIKFVQSALIYSLLAPLFRRLCRHLLPIQLFILIIFSDECEDFLFSDSAILRREVSPLGGVFLSFRLNWEECRRHDLIFNKNTQNGRKYPHSAEII